MRIAAIINPRAGGWARLREAQAATSPSEAVARWLAPEEPESLWRREMGGPNEGARLVSEAVAAGCDTIVAVGGDGTINEVIQGIQSLATEKQPRLGLIPMGTANVLARALSLPRRDPAAAAEIVRTGVERRIDLGRLGARWFALVAGIGFDGAVTEAVNLRLKRHVKEWAYILAAAQVALTFPRRPVTLTLDDGAPQTFDAYLILVANAGRYAGRFRLGPDVCLSDGLLDVFVCLRREPLVGSIAADALALVGNRFHTAPGVRHFRARRLALDADGPLPIELDGDAAGTTPATITVAPGALRILTPQAA